MKSFIYVTKEDLIIKIIFSTSIYDIQGTASNVVLETAVSSRDILELRLLKCLALVSKSKSLISPRSWSPKVSPCLGLEIQISRSCLLKLASFESILLYGFILVLYLI